MVVMCNGIDIVIVIIEHNERRSGLPNKPLHTKQDTNRTEQ